MAQLQKQQKFNDMINLEKAVLQKYFGSNDTIFFLDITTALVPALLTHYYWH